MRLVTPVSHQFADREFGSQVRLLSDSLEARPENMVNTDFWDESVSHIHFSSLDLDLNLQWRPEDRYVVEVQLNRFQHSLHLATFHISRDFPLAKIDSKGRFVPHGEALSREEMLDNVGRNIEWMKTLSTSVSIGIENNNYYATRAYEIATSPDFIARVISDFKISFLFDVAHAQVAAGNMGVSLEDYVAHLPLESTEQLHISRPSMRESGEHFDAHLVPRIEDFLRARDLLARRVDFGDLAVTVEHYQTKEPLTELLIALRNYDA